MKPIIAAALLAIYVLPRLSSAQQQQQPPPKGSIEGSVVRAGTGEPIVGARITANRAGAGQIIQSGVPLQNIPPGAVVLSNLPNIPGLGAATPFVITDNQGRFVFKDLDPSSYRLTAGANGYARQDFGQRVYGAQGTPITLAAGQILKDVSFRLTPAGNVNGR